MNKKRKNKTSVEESSVVKKSDLKKPASNVLQRSYLILEFACESTNKFFSIFERFRKGKAGTTSYEEQDLLRAMVVFSAAGFDSLLKQIIRDALPDLLPHSESAKESLNKFTRRALRGSSTDDDSQELIETDHRFLASVLLSDVPRNGVIDSLVDDLIGESLQSTKQIFKALNHLGMDDLVQEVSRDVELLKKVFNCRNQIVHEMDVDFERSKKKRIQRKREEMKEYCKKLLTLGNSILGAADNGLKKTVAMK